MKILKRNFLLHIPFYIFDYPLFIFGIILSIVDFSFKSLVLTIIFWAASGAAQAAVTHRYNAKLYFNFFFLYFLRYRNCTFNRYRLEDFIPKAIVNEFLTERFGIGLSKKELGYITVVKRKKGIKGKPFPGAMTAFPFETQPWYIMVSDEKDDFFDYQWFLLFHELGHTMLYHRIPLERSINLPLQIIILMFILLLICPFTISIIVLVITLSLFSFYLFAFHKTPEINFEILADTFSIFLLNSVIAKKVVPEHVENLKIEILNLDIKLHENNIKDLEYRIENANDALEYKLNNMQEGDVVNIMKKFNIAAKRLLWVNWYYYLPLITLVFVGIYYRPELTWYPSLIGLLIILISFIITMFNISGYKKFFINKIEVIMNEKEVSDGLFPEHLLNAEKTPPKDTKEERRSFKF